MQEAVDERSEHVSAFQDFDATLPSESTAEWTMMFKAWEQDFTQPNPFASKQRREFALFFKT